jgi:hypothetical protein
MKKYALALLVILLVGCSATKEISTVTSEALYVSSEINSGTAQGVLYSVELTGTEKMIVTHALNYQAQFETKWKSSVKDPTLLLSNFEALRLDYFVLKTRYLEVQEVVQDNWDRYPEEAKLRFTLYQAHADNLDTGIVALMDISDRQETLHEMLGFAMMLGRIGLALK